jgi:hypothetical protein
MNVEEVARIVISLAREVEDPVSVDTLHIKAEELLASPAFSGFTEDQVVTVARSMVNVTARNDTEIISDTGYEPWVATRFATCEKPYWRRYFTYLSEVKCLPERSLAKLDDSTDRVIDLLRDPLDNSDWDRRGLIVGDVQSGKTSNYTGLICKAIDAGYKLVIILAGAHNNLRAQTQIRIDEGVLGFDTRYAQNREEEGARRQRIGVGDLPPKHISPIVNSLTTSNDNGDFKRATVEGSLIGLGGDPNILCLKKNKSILDNVIIWLKTHGEPRSDGSVQIRNTPLLLIDDEADYASVNTADYVDENGNVIPDRDPTAINAKIREILGLFSRSAYVGYTATPFANIFIHNETKEAIAKEDLFPRSFIRNVHAPSNYIGAEKFFGLMSEDSDEKDIPQVQHVQDAHVIFPPKHKKDLDVIRIPASMKEAFADFVLACAVRAARGQSNVHNSMLIHVTRFTDVQHQVFEIVNDYKGECLRSLRYDRESVFRDSLKNRYENEFRPDCLAATRYLELDDCADVAWPEVENHILAVIEKIDVREINGSAGDVLDYLDHPNGLNVVAIGGDKLSRGLTLEGLTVSYFLRASRMYDTLLQMGRWFGYRSGYADVCRLWTTPELVGWFQHIARAMSKLRDEFDHMAAIRATPEEYGLRVATHPDGMMVTGPAKMRAASEHRAGYNNTTAISTTFDCSSHALKTNYDAVEELVRTRSTQPKQRRGLLVWNDVSADDVIEFLGQMIVPPTVITSNTALIAQYISEMVAKEGELVNWTLGLAENGKGSSAEIAGHQIHLTHRTNIATNDRRSNNESYTVRTSLSPAHELVDLTEDQIADARKNAETTKTPSGPYIRAERSSKNGLLLIYLIEIDDSDIPMIGFAISFPNSRNGHVINFKVNKVYSQNYMKDMFDVD